MKEQLNTLSLQQLLKVAREYNKAVGVPVPSGVLKKDLIEYILKHAKDVGTLLKIMASVRDEEKPIIPQVKRSKEMDDLEYSALVRKRERAVRGIARAKLKYEPIVEGEKMTKEDEKKYKAEVKAIKDKFK